ncbi:AAC(3)-I family aminoglycoside N-acetyltransferase [Parvularcula lutaonensis]|uniref:AAC(3)-I family aminoglycoside N-acetyltransferase n=1 Tax=Parvularcula lutaonensis TaxID=491923 RepID=A0ABV7MF96_9PROT|nr:AAC(3)-I family aminoglycoside N-acetyltransferase [Parvularcula lutaonensis]GGY55224.1 hypothetical protein GCM10007148_26340 [Parvularcula lutaonensis]
MAEIKRLGPDDVSLFRKMMRMFGEAFVEPGNYSAEGVSAAYQRERLGDPTFFALAALAKGKVVGGLCAYELLKFEQQRSEIYIYDLAVDARHRRKGIATALIDELRLIAQACGAWTIFVQADHGDDEAIALYTKLGTREDVLHFDIKP